MYMQPIKVHEKQSHALRCYYSCCYQLHEFDQTWTPLLQKYSSAETLQNTITCELLPTIATHNNRVGITTCYKNFLVHWQHGNQLLQLTRKKNLMEIRRMQAWYRQPIQTNKVRIVPPQQARIPQSHIVIPTYVAAIDSGTCSYVCRGGCVGLSKLIVMGQFLFCLCTSFAYTIPTSF